MTQADFACRLGVTGASVSAYENGTRLPSYDILIRIANILGVSTDSLLGRRGMGSVTLDVSRLTQEQRGILQRTADLFADYNRLSGGGVSGEKRSKGELTVVSSPFEKRSCTGAAPSVRTGISPQRRRTGRPAPRKRRQNR
ncbi:helix-turn-helix domain-containing protein [Flavonifractor plautii]|nr:helix-turn-helix domain-containing protein [Flavonifractor plautii]